MYERTGKIVSRYPLAVIAAWVVFLVVTASTAPAWVDVLQDGEFAFLPEDAISRRAETLFAEAFPAAGGVRFEDDSVGTSVQQDPLGSNIAIVLEREDRRDGLTEEDRKFIDEVLVPKLERIGETTGRGYTHVPLAEAETIPPEERVIRAITSPSDRRIGPLLVSPDQKSTLVVVELSTEFLDRQNALVISRIEELLEDDQLQEAKPLGLALALSGSATVGRDMLRAEALSASRTESFTKALVIVLLLLIYRAPFLAMIPLMTVGIAVELSLALLRHLAGWNVIGLFTGIDVYVTVVVYGAGVDYCLFLIARYKEELDSGRDFREAISMAVRMVGVALATSAGTSICGIAMMGFAEFGKFRQAGFAISFGLFVVLCFAMTFTPAVLQVVGRWAFWPDVRQERFSSDGGWLPVSSLFSRLRQQRWIDRGWQKVTDMVEARPATVFITTILLMMPFAIVAVTFRDHLSYGLLTDLPQDEPSVQGARVLQKHFAAGITGPTSMVLKFDEEALQNYFDGDDLTDVRTAEKLSEEISEGLKARRAELNIEDLRSQHFPLGQTPGAEEYLRSLPLAQRGAKRNFAHRTYTSTRGPYAGQVMRLDLVFSEDPFARDSIAQLNLAEEGVLEAIPQELRESTEVLALGATAGIRDLKLSTDRDQIRIDILVVLSVYLVLVLLLRRPAICAYLIVSVVFSYLVALGATFVVFYLRDPTAFTGIDWKTPIFLFTLLIAMGEDYNILLMARVTEEQEKHGLAKGVLVALTKTGSIISSCGIIMAGTFSSLMTGSLLGMVHLGFALAFGVLLDTFVVRPILVPAYLMMLYTGRFGWLGPWLGASQPAASKIVLHEEAGEPADESHVPAES